jgi:hypothetical protein
LSGLLVKIYISYKNFNKISWIMFSEIYLNSYFKLLKNTCFINIWSKLFDVIFTIFIKQKLESCTEESCMDMINFSTCYTLSYQLSQFFHIRINKKKSICFCFFLFVSLYTRSIVTSQYRFKIPVYIIPACIQHIRL